MAGADATEDRADIKGRHARGFSFVKQPPGNDVLRDRYTGCLLGGAVGDALGAPVEFMSRREILSRFGTGGIKDFAPAYGSLGCITDDTQMTLFTAEGLLRAWVRGMKKGITSYQGVTQNAYQRWLHTQNEAWEAQPAESDGWLINHHELHHRRAPGSTCLSALRTGTDGGRASNDSKGCGGVMRMAPVGLFAGRVSDQMSPDEAFGLGAELAALTHGHPTGSLTGGVLALLVMMLVDGVELSDALAGVKDILKRRDRHEETLSAIVHAEQLAREDSSRHDAISNLGEGWIAEEALAISIYCALVAQDFEDGVVLAVNHDGDSDSTGAIAGNLLGAMNGIKAIPSRWLASLELRDVIQEIAVDLYDFPTWGRGQLDPDELWSKYPGH